MFQTIKFGLVSALVAGPRARFVGVFAACLATVRAISPTVRGAGLVSPFRYVAAHFERRSTSSKEVMP